MRHYVWAILWGILVLVLVCMPIDNAAKSVPKFEGIDKLVHTGFFFVFSVLLFYGALMNGKSTKPSMKVICWITLTAIAFALFTEYLQYQFFVYRSAEFWDFFADMVGTGMGVFSYILLHRFATNITPNKTV